MVREDVGFSGGSGVGMVKTPPIGELVGSRTFETKGEANAYAVSQRRKKAEQGYKTRYEVDMDPQTGKFRVREFVYNTDSKGRLV